MVEVKHTEAEKLVTGWQDMSTAPLCWMPNVMIPDEFLPWMNSAKVSPPTREEGGRDDE